MIVMLYETIVLLSALTGSKETSFKCDIRRPDLCQRERLQATALQWQQPIRKDERPWREKGPGDGAERTEPPPTIQIDLSSWPVEEDRSNGRPAGEDLFTGMGTLPSGSLPMGSLAGGSTLVGEVCRESGDCVQGATCELGRCRCMMSHVQIETYCWKRINPEQSGCTYDAQCEAVSPGARCVFSICRCNGNRSPSATREGPVCHPQGHCPTNGAHSLLYNRNSASLAQCFFFDGESDRRAGKFIGCDDFPEVYDCIDGLCCPTRALTCTQPMDSGEDDITNKGNSTQSPLIRWFFNPITYTCERFEYSGVGGNSNNFLTLSHCESYCALRCPRGQPQLDATGNEAGPTDPFASLAASCVDDRSTCDTERFTCTHVTGYSFCCPSPAFICSELGGLLEETIDLIAQPTSTPYSSGSNRQGQAAVTRWYWDRVERKCRTFRYFGQGGNFNNFLSENHCNDFCAKSLCPMGAALRDSSGAHIECSSTSQCPRSHSCHAGVCCPSPATICNQPLVLGSPCSSQTVRRFWFNSATRSCQSFAYSGCDGNSNNFRTAHDCSDFCSRIEDEPQCPVGEAVKLEEGKYWSCGATKTRGSGGLSSARDERSCPANYECHFDGKNYGCCPTKEFTCRLQPDEGRACGGPPQQRWYFDDGARACRSFEYNGCDGNSNNFRGQKECSEYCAASGCPNGGDVHRINGEPLPCTKDSHCPPSQLCTPLLLQRQSSQERFCCPTRAAVCSELLDVGFSCAEPSRRYHFDLPSRTCRPFTYRGCGGNANNFVTKLACNNVCMAAACAPSEMAYQPSSSETPFDCSIRSCPKGYLCVPDPTSMPAGIRKICCGAPNMGVCPSNQRPLLDYRNQRPLSCSSMRVDDCPEKFRCTFNTERSEHFCCAEQHDTLMCPSGARLLRDPSTGDAVGCNTDSACPESAACHRPHPFHTGVCCHNLDNVCPPMFSLERELTDSRECSPLVPHSCSQSLKVVCLFSEKLDRFVCCKRENIKSANENLSRCPANTNQDQNRTVCSSTALCPAPFFCIRQNNERVGVCCKHPLAVMATSNETEGKAGVDQNARKAGFKKAKKHENTDDDSNPEDEDEDEEETDEKKEQPSVKSKIAKMIDKERNAKNGSPGPETERKTSTAVTTTTTTTVPTTTARSTIPSKTRETSVNNIGNSSEYSSLSSTGFGVECSSFERALVDRSTGRPILCAPSVPCPAPYQCKQAGPQLFVCCALAKPVGALTIMPPSPQFPHVPSPIPSVGSPFQPLLPSVTGPSPFPSILSVLPTSPPANTFSGSPGPYIPNPSVPQPNPYISGTRSGSGGDEINDLQSCPDGMVAFSTDGQIHSCVNAHCPPKYKCVREVCCPMRSVSCRDPVFHGTECNDPRIRGATRFYYDLTLQECRPFDYRGCNPGANHFLDLMNCERTCLAEDEDEGKSRGGRRNNVRKEGGNGRRAEGERRAPLCPPPYVNPRDTPQICSPFFDSCPGNQKCLPSRDQHYLCCATPSSTSLRSLIARMCGEGYKPVMSPSGDPRRCDPARLPCSRRDECRFSTVLMIDICCQSEDAAEDSTEAVGPRSVLGSVFPRGPRGGGGYGPPPYSRIRSVSGGDMASYAYPRSSWMSDDSIRICRREEDEKENDGREHRKCLPRLHPGQTGCLADAQCLGDSSCLQGRCECENGALLYRSLCVSSCPPLYRVVRGVCV